MQHEVRYSSGRVAIALVMLMAVIGLSACGKSETPADPTADDRIAPIGKVETDAPVSAPAAMPAAEEPAMPAAEDSAAPTEQVAAADAPAAAEPAGAVDGKKVYDSVCFACHTTGAAGAPMIGNKDQWAPRIGQGMDLLHKHALEGIRGMPPKGGAMSLSNAEVEAAVDYIVEMSK